MATTVKAHRVGSGSRRPRTYITDRVCAEKSCETVLSRYNKADRCHQHAPLRFPRLRGVISDA